MFQHYSEVFNKNYEKFNKSAKMFNNTNMHKTIRQRSKVTHISNFFFFNQTHSFYSAQKHFETHIKQFCYMKFEAYKIRRV